MQLYCPFLCPWMKGLLFWKENNELCSSSIQRRVCRAEVCPRECGGPFAPWQERWCSLHSNICGSCQSRNSLQRSLRHLTILATHGPCTRNICRAQFTGTWVKISTAIVCFTFPRMPGEAVEDGVVDWTGKHYANIREQHLELASQTSGILPAMCRPYRWRHSLKLSLVKQCWRVWFLEVSSMPALFFFLPEFSCIFLVETTNPCIKKDCHRIS